MLCEWLLPTVAVIAQPNGEGRAPPEAAQRVVQMNNGFCELALQASVERRRIVTTTAKASEGCRTVYLDWF